MNLCQSKNTMVELHIFDYPNLVVQELIVFHKLYIIYMCALAQNYFASDFIGF